MNDIALYVSKTIFGAFEVFGTTYIAMSLFRYPAWQYMKEILFISSVSAIAATLHYDVFNFHIAYNELFVLLTTIIMFKLFLKTSIWYSFVITVVGYLMGMVVIYLFYFIFSDSLGWVTAYDLTYNLTTLTILQICHFVILVFIGDLIHKYGIGFTMSSDKFIADHRIRKVNMLLFTTLLLDVLAAEIAYTTKSHFYIFSSLLVVNVVIWVLYKKAHKEMQEHYKRFDVAAIARKIK